MRPRGHYTETEALRRYFRSMMWLGRTEMRLTAPPDVPHLDVTRERIDAVLVGELVAGSDAARLLTHMESILKPLVGSPDNVTLAELNRLGAALGLERADALLDAGTMMRSHTKLQAGRYRAQAINSQILYSDVFDPRPMELPYAFRLVGPRFVLDSYVTGNVVFDRMRIFGLGFQTYQPSAASELQTAPLPALLKLAGRVVADSWLNSVGVFDPAGQPLAILVDEEGKALDLGSPNDIALGADNRIYIAERLSARLQIREILDDAR